MYCIGPSSISPASKKRRKSAAAPASEGDRAGLLADALHLLQRSQAVGESGIEALHGEEGFQELENNIVGADATIKAWRFMQVTSHGSSLTCSLECLSYRHSSSGTVAVAANESSSPSDNSTCPSETC